MKNSVFVAFCLVIVSALVSAHALFRQTLSPVKRLEKEVVHLEKERREAEFKARLVAHQLADYQQHVATLLPDAMRGRSDQGNYPLRQLASVIGAGSADDTLEIERASGLMEKAKAAFRSKNFEVANNLLQKLIDRFPDSVHVPEANFLLSEGQFQLKDYEASVATIERMIDLFPENELTGFALLRLGSIFEMQERLEDAGDIYRAVISNFNRPDLVKQASSSLKAVAL
jgi:TolA-binding protein